MSNKYFATVQEVQLAKKRHCYGSDNEIEVDETVKGIRISRGDDGAWIRAWVFVPKELINDYSPD